LEITVTNQNWIFKEAISRFKFRECLLPFIQFRIFLSKNFKIEIYRTTILHAFSIGMKLGLSHKDAWEKPAEENIWT
jgi:hypothetical protein